MKSIFLPAAQLVMLVLWYTAFPTLPAWLVFIPLMLWGVGVVIAIAIVLGALFIAGSKGTKFDVKFK